jgi:hypothetical protein
LGAYVSLSTSQIRSRSFLLARLPDRVGFMNSLVPLLDTLVRSAMWAYGGKLERGEVRVNLLARCTLRGGLLRGSVDCLGRSEAFAGGFVEQAVGKGIRFLSTVLLSDGDDFFW